MPLTAEERHRLTSQIAMSLCNLQLVNFFWSSSCRRLFARAGFRDIEDCYRPSRGRGGALPSDAVHVGFYEHGIGTSIVLQDIDDALQLPPVTPRAIDAPISGSVAAPRSIPETRWQWARVHFDHSLPARDRRRERTG